MNLAHSQVVSRRNRALANRRGQPVGWGTLALAIVMTSYSWLILGLSAVYVIRPTVLSAHWLGSTWLNPIFAALFLPVLFMMWLMRQASSVTFWGSGYFFNILCSLVLLAFHKEKAGLIIATTVVRVAFAAWVIRWTT